MKKNYLLFLIILLFISCKTELIHQKYTVTFDSDGGTAVSSQEIEEGNFAQKPDTPIKEDYDFIDWYIGETLFDFFTPITSDITLKAKWDKKTFTVIFDSDGGSEVTSQVIEIKSTVTKPEDPTKDECDFLGWYISDSLFDFSTPITSNITLKAKWEKQSSQTVPEEQKESTSVTLDSNDENKNTSQEIENGSSDIPSEEKKQFYTVTFDSNDGSGVLSQKIESGKTVSRPEDPYRERYNFIGWFLGDNKFDFSTPITSKITLKAKWEQITFTVTFDFNGAKDNIEKEVEKGKLVTNESASWTSHKFQGWFYEDTLFDFSTPINTDLILKAKWVKICNVTFDYENGNKVEKEVYEGDYVEKPSDPSKDNYSFAGWFYDGSRYNFSTPINSDLTLTARWYNNKAVGSKIIGSYDKVAYRLYIKNNGKSLSFVNKNLSNTASNANISTNYIDISPSFKNDKAYVHGSAKPNKGYAIYTYGFYITRKMNNNGNATFSVERGTDYNLSIESVSISSEYSSSENTTLNYVNVYINIF